MFKCRECGMTTEREYLKEVKGDFESDYGVGNLFESRTSYTKHICPECGSDDVEEAVQCWDCREWFLKEELDYNVDNNLVCKDCREE